MLYRNKPFNKAMFKTIVTLANQSNNYVDLDACIEFKYPDPSQQIWVYDFIQSGILYEDGTLNEENFFYQYGFVKMMETKGISEDGEQILVRTILIKDIAFILLENFIDFRLFPEGY